jgi:hypothetical protein
MRSAWNTTTIEATRFEFFANAFDASGAFGSSKTELPIVRSPWSVPAPASSQEQ